MAVNKNFVVKNGIEVATDLIFASSDLDKVGIGSTIPTKLLEVGGDAKVTGNTELVGVTTITGATRLSGGGGITTTGGDFYVGGDLYVSDDITIDEFTGRRVDATEAISTNDFNVTGVSTFAGRVSIADSILHTGDTDTSIRFPTADTFTVETAGSEAVRVDSSGRLLLGTTTEGAALADNFTVADSADCGISIRSGTTNYGSIYFSDGTSGADEYRGQIEYNHNTDVLKFYAGASNKITVDSTKVDVSGILSATGNVFVGSAVSIYASAGVVSATSFYGDGSNLSGVTATAGGALGFATANAVGYGVTFLKFVGAGVSTLSAPHSGIATLTIVGGGGGGSASIGIGTTQGDAFSTDPVAGNLWYHTELGRLFIYYNDGSSAQWVDAAPFNVGIITSGLRSLNQGTALSPSLAFSGDSATGLFSPATGKQTLVSVGASILNINQGGIEVTGVSSVGLAITMYGSTGVVSATSFYGSGANLTSLAAANLSGTLPALNGSNLTDLNGSNIASGTVAAARVATLNQNTTGTAGGLTGTPDIIVNNITGAAVTFTGNLNVEGVLTYEDVTNVDSVGLITARSGIICNGVGIGLSVPEGGVRVTGVCSATDFDTTSDVNLKENIHTVDNGLDLVNQLRGVRFDWKDTGYSTYGVIAQELEQVLPELVSDADPKTVKYNGIIGVLIEAVKELSDRVKALEDK